MNLHIHFGVHRTGSTSLQNLLKNNKVHLLNNGFLYPHLNVDYKHTKIAWQLLNRKINVRELTARIDKELSASVKTILLISEDFSQLKNAYWLKELAKKYDLSASVYLKRQDLWLESWYNQHIKWPWMKKFSNSTIQEFTRSLDDFYWIDYNFLLSEICKYVPKNRLYVHTMTPENPINGIGYFFANVLSMPTPITNKEAGNMNASLSRVQLEIVRKIDLFELLPPQRRRILKIVKSLEIKEDSGSKSIMSYDMRRKILSQYAVSNGKVAKDFFDSNDLFHPLREGSICDDHDRSLIVDDYLGEIIKRLAG